MAANTAPVFTLTPKSKTIAGTATANTSRTTFATGFDVVTGATDGTRVEGIWFTAVGSTTAGMIRIWQYESVAAGYFLIGELPVGAITASGTVAAWQGYWAPPLGPLVLASGDKLGFTTNAAEAFNATPIANDF